MIHAKSGRTTEAGQDQTPCRRRSLTGSAFGSMSTFAQRCRPEPQAGASKASLTSSRSPPDLPDAVDAKVFGKDAADLPTKLSVTALAGRCPAGIGPSGGALVIGRWGDLAQIALRFRWQNPADRLDPAWFAMSATVSSVPLVLRQAAIPVARTLWLPTLVAIPTVVARLSADHRVGVRLR